MATVRITSDIRFHVKQHIETMFNDRIERKKQELSNLGIGDLCYAYYVPAEYRELAERLNNDPEGPWMDVVDKVTIKLTYTTNDPEPSTKSTSFMAPLCLPAPLPTRFRMYSTMFQLLETMAPYEPAKKIFLEIDDLTKERSELVNNIVFGILTECNTLRQVLEVWPTALDFMPDSVKRMHAAKTEKRKPAKGKVQIDDDLKVSLIKARLLASG